MSSSSLFYAVGKNNFDLLEKLIKTYKISDVNYLHFKWKKSLLLIATIENSYDIVKLLLESKIDVNQVFGDGVNALMLSLNYMLDKKVHNDEITKLLIINKININAENDKGFTSLMIACKDKYATSTIKLLIENKADINYKNKNALTALMCAVKENNYPVRTTR
ncbi:MAG: ankyrin repeat domain-containing protein [Sulfurovum sp.]|nr:ankyrin repeat domain-containing protein [Sulfurovum sp.]